MNIFRTAAFQALAAALALPLLALAFAGCDIDSVDSTTAVISDDNGILNFSGLYMHPDNTDTNIFPLVFPTGKQSGTTLTWLRLLQYGSALEAYDNAGMTWSGSVSMQSGTASFNLQGQTTAGQSVEIFGTLVGNNDSEDPEASMDGSWVEPNFYGSIRAKATVAPTSTNTPTSELSLVSSFDSISLSNSVSFTASGCSSTYTWDCDETFGTFSPADNTAFYIRTSGTSSNSVTVTVHCGSASKSKTVEFN